MRPSLLASVSGPLEKKKELCKKHRSGDLHPVAQIYQPHLLIPNSFQQGPRSADGNVILSIRHSWRRQWPPFLLLLQPRPWHVWQPQQPIGKRGICHMSSAGASQQPAGCSTGNCSIQTPLGISPSEQSSLEDLRGFLLSVYKGWFFWSLFFGVFFWPQILPICKPSRECWMLSKTLFATKHKHSSSLGVSSSVRPLEVKSLSGLKWCILTLVSTHAQSHNNSSM